MGWASSTVPAAGVASRRAPGAGGGGRGGRVSRACLRAIAATPDRYRNAAKPASTASGWLTLPLPRRPRRGGRGRRADRTAAVALAPALREGR